MRLLRLSRIKKSRNYDNEQRSLFCGPCLVFHPHGNSSCLVFHPHGNIPNPRFSLCSSICTPVSPQCGYLIEATFLANRHSMLFQSYYLTKRKRWQLGKKRQAKVIKCFYSISICRTACTLHLWAPSYFGLLYALIGISSADIKIIFLGISSADIKIIFLGCKLLTKIICLHCVSSSSLEAHIYSQ